MADFFNEEQQEQMAKVYGRKPWFEHLVDAETDPKGTAKRLGYGDLEVEPTYAASLLYDADEAMNDVGEWRDLQEAQLDEAKNQRSPFDFFGMGGVSGAMGPIISKWGEGVKAGERMGQSARNLEKTVGKQMEREIDGPTKVLFHRTRQEYAPSIKETGLKAKSPNQGQNTGDQYSFPDVVWMADNPVDIPVLNTSFGGFSVKNNPDVATFKMEMPLKDYNNMKRYKLFEGSGGRGAVEVKPGESAVSKDHSRRTGRVGTELVGEDIDPKYLTELPKIPKDEMDEAERLWDWLGNAAEEDIEKLPLELRNNINALFKNKYIKGGGEPDVSKLRSVMKEWPQYRNGRDVPDSFDWDKYNQLKMEEETASPRELATQAFKPGTMVKKPWNEDVKKYFPEDVYEKFNNGSISRGVDIDYQRDANFRNANQGKKFAKEARESGNSMKQQLANHHYGTIKDAIKGDPESAYAKYQRALSSPYLPHKAMAELERRYGATMQQLAAEGKWNNQVAEEYNKLLEEVYRNELQSAGASPIVQNFILKQLYGGNL